MHYQNKKFWIQLAEAANQTERDLGVYTWEKLGAKSACAIDMSKLNATCQKVIQDSENIGLWDLEKEINAAILAFVSIEQPTSQCNGAWEVKKSIARKKGDGSITYGMAYWMSPTGSLISDREAISKKAVKAWYNLSQKVQGIPLDDATNPQNSDPGDDCTVWSSSKSPSNANLYIRKINSLPEKDANALNQSYTVEPKYNFDDLRRRFSKFMIELPPEIINPATLAEMLEYGAEDLFELRLNREVGV